MKSFLSHTDALLRVQEDDREFYISSGKFRILLSQLIVFGIIYGASMGSYTAVEEGRHYLQIIYSAIKSPLLLIATFLISLPSFFVINSLFGLRDDFNQVMRALVATQASLTIILASFAPVTVFWYISVEDYQSAVALNAVIFGLASILAQRILCRHYSGLVNRNPKHIWLRRVWLIIYTFVGIEMGWVLRPFIGNPGEPVHFFRSHAWGNAYEQLWNIILQAIGVH